MKATLLLFTLLASTAFFARAEDKPLLAVPGKVLYENTFSSAPDAKWKAAKGKWESTDGALRGSEKAEDKHAGVTRTELKLQDFIVQYEIKFEGAKMSSLSINAAKGHLARILIAPTSVQVQKDDSDHEGPDKAVIFARMAADIKPGTWHTVRLEMAGDTMLGKVDDLVAFGSNEAFTKEKANFGFTVSGQSVDVRNLKVWSATKNPEWDSIKDTLPKAAPAIAAAGKPAAKKKKSEN